MLAVRVTVRFTAAMAVLALLALAGCATAPRKADRPPAPALAKASGIASYYAKSLNGRRTASGERYDGKALTAAHRTLPFGSRVRVTNLGNGRSVVVRINDRGPFVRGRVIDLTPAGARAIGFSGVAPVSLSVLGKS